MRTLNDVLNLYPHTSPSDWVRKNNVKLGGGLEEGGWIFKEARVDPSAFVGKDAIVAGSAQVKENSRILDTAIVDGNSIVDKQATIKDNAKVTDTSYVTDSSIVKGNSEVSNNSTISKTAEISGNSKIKGNSFVTDSSQVGGDAIVDDDVHIYHRSIVGEKAVLKDQTQLFNDSRVFGSAQVSGITILQDDSRIYGSSDISEITIMSGNSQILDHTVTSDTLLLSSAMKDSVVTSLTSKSDEITNQIQSNSSHVVVRPTLTEITPIPIRPSSTTKILPATEITSELIPTGRLISRPLGNGVDQNYEVIHTLKTTNFLIMVWDVSETLIYPDINLEGLNKVKINFQDPMALDGCRILLWEPPGVVVIPFEGGFPNKVYHNLKSTNLIASMFKNYWPFTQVWSDLRITDPNSIQISATPDHYRINLWSFDSKDQYDKKKTFLIGDGVNKSYLIQHNLDSKDLFVSLFQTHQPLVENFVDIKQADINHLLLEFQDPPLLDQFQLSVCVGY